MIVSVGVFVGVSEFVRVGVEVVVGVVVGVSVKVAVTEGVGVEVSVIVVYALSYSVFLRSIYSLTAGVPTTTNGATIMSVFRLHLATTVDALRGGIALIFSTHCLVYCTS